MSTAILPCPFDGAPATLQVDWGNEVWNMKAWCQCTSCGVKGEKVEGPSTYGYNPAFHKRTAVQAQADAVAWWNRRP